MTRLFTVFTVVRPVEPREPPRRDRRSRRALEDILTVPAPEILQTEVLTTIFGGEVVVEK